MLCSPKLLTSVEAASVVAHFGGAELGRTFHNCNAPSSRSFSPPGDDVSNKRRGNDALDFGVAVKKVHAGFPFVVGSFGWVSRYLLRLAAARRRRTPCCHRRSEAVPSASSKRTAIRTRHMGGRLGAYGDLVNHGREPPGLLSNMALFESPLCAARVFLLTVRVLGICHREGDPRPQSRRGGDRAGLCARQCPRSCGHALTRSPGSHCLAAFDIRPPPEGIVYLFSRLGRITGGVGDLEGPPCKPC